VRSETNAQLADAVKRLALDMPSEEQALTMEMVRRFETGATTPAPVADVEIGDKLAEKIAVMVNGEEREALFSEMFTKADLPIYALQGDLMLDAPAAAEEQDEAA